MTPNSGNNEPIIIDSKEKVLALKGGETVNFPNNSRNFTVKNWINDTIYLNGGRINTRFDIFLPDGSYNILHVRQGKDRGITSAIWDKLDLWEALQIGEYHVE